MCMSWSRSKLTIACNGLTPIPARRYVDVPWLIRSVAAWIWAKLGVECRIPIRLHARYSVVLNSPPGCSWGKMSGSVRLSARNTYTCADRFRLLFLSASISIACASRVRIRSSYSFAYWSSMKGVIFIDTASCTYWSTSYMAVLESSSGGGSVYHRHELLNTIVHKAHPPDRRQAYACSRIRVADQTSYLGALLRSWRVRRVKMRIKPRFHLRGHCRISEIRSLMGTWRPSINREGD